VLGALDAAEAKAATPGAILTLTGNTLISKVGGASGPLYGTAFRRAGKALGGAADVDLAALSAALDAALAGVQQLGAARRADKTMVALAPAAGPSARRSRRGRRRTTPFPCSSRRPRPAPPRPYPCRR
jgi:dihydroxyacetone kinase-like protein